jgi:Flp pilus assembly protein TadG
MVTRRERLSQLLGRFVREERAVSAVEFAAAAPIIIAIILCTLQVGVIFVAKAYLETGAEQAARDVLDNKAATFTQAQFNTDVCNQLSALFNCGSLIIQLSSLPETATSVNSYLPQFNADGSLQNPVSYSAGTGGEIMLLTVMYEWPVYGGILGLNWGSFSNGTMLMTSTQIFKVES